LEEDALVPKFLEQWTVSPHGPVRTVDDGIVTVEGEIAMPLGKFPRRMTVVALSGGRSAIFSAIALKEPDMRRIEELGKPTFLIVPNGHHRLDARIFKQRFPKLKILCPQGAKDSVSKAVSVDSTKDILKDRSVDLVTVGGTGGAEAAMVVRRAGGTTLIVNDVLANVRHPNGLGAKIMARLFGFGVSGPQVPRVVKRVMIKGKRALADQFRSWASDPDLRRILVSHGDVIDSEASAVLRSLARELKS
jgi:hypothetical protein